MAVKIGAKDGDTRVLWTSEEAGQSWQEPMCGVSGKAGVLGGRATAHLNMRNKIKRENSFKIGIAKCVNKFYFSLLYLLLLLKWGAVMVLDYLFLLYLITEAILLANPSNLGKGIISADCKCQKSSQTQCYFHSYWATISLSFDP